MMMITLLALAAPVVVVAPPPPTAPPIIRAAYERPAETRGFDIAISHDGKSLWEGRLATATNGRASFSQRREMSVACPADAAERNQRERPVNFAYSLNVSLSPIYIGDRMHLSVQWQRPSIQDGPTTLYCDGFFTRTASIAGEIDLKDGKPAILMGDAGLKVIVTPRDD